MRAGSQMRAGMCVASALNMPQCASSRCHPERSVVDDEDIDAFIAGTGRRFITCRHGRDGTSDCEPSMRRLRLCARDGLRVVDAIRVMPTLAAEHDAPTINGGLRKPPT